jgi:RNA polymerase I-specific transcription initiation factor RRN6
MDERKSAVQPARAKTRRVPADGIIGRLTYTPAEGDECIGQIGRNRAQDESEYFILIRYLVHPLVLALTT